MKTAPFCGMRPQTRYLHTKELPDARYVQWRSWKSFLLAMCAWKNTTLGTSPVPPRTSSMNYEQDEFCTAHSLSPVLVHVGAGMHSQGVCWGVGGLMGTRHQLSSSARLSSLLPPHPLGLGNTQQPAGVTSLWSQLSEFHPPPVPF